MTRAQIRRLLALAPDGDARGLHAALAPLAPPGAIDQLRAYLFDPLARPLGPELTGPLFAPVPGGVAPLDDRIAAILVAPTILLAPDAIPIDLLRHRWSPRADDVVALAVANQPLPLQPALLSQLAADLGPEPDTLALSAVQCGRVLVWAPHLLEWPLAEEIVGALLALLDPARPEPLLALVARALAPLAARPGPVPERIRVRARAAIDQDSAVTALARAGAYILGFAADPAGALVDTFLDGLVAAANVPLVADLVATALAHGDDEAAALALAARLPLDPLADVLRAALDDPDFGELAAHACLLLDGAEDLPLGPRPAPDPDPPPEEIVRRIAADQPREDRLAAIAICGHALPPDHAAWESIRTLLARDDLDLRDAAWCALRDRVRRF